MAASTQTATYSDQPKNPKAVRSLEVKKLDLLVKIGELQLELQKTNAALYKQGVRIEIAMCW